MAILNGWKDVQATQWLSMMAPDELKLLLCGSPHFNIDDWQAHTIIESSPYNETRVPDAQLNQIKTMFFNCLRGEDYLFCSKIYFNWTGLRKPPPLGFAHGPRLTIAIRRPNLQDGYFFNFSTCFTRLTMNELYDGDLLKQELIAAQQELGFSAA